MSGVNAHTLFGFTKFARTDELDEDPPAEWYRRPGVVGAGAAAASLPLLYALARHRRLSSNPELRKIQEASKGRFTRVLGKADPGTWHGRLFDRLYHAGSGDIRYSGGSKGKMENIPGVVRHFGPSGAKQFSGDVNVGLNKNMPDLTEGGRDKWKEFKFFDKHAPGTMPASENMKDVLRELGYSKAPTTTEGRKRMLGDVQAHLSDRYGKGFVLKDTDGVQSSGLFPSHEDNFVNLRRRYNDLGLREREKELRRAAKGDTSQLNNALAELRAAPDGAYAGRVLEKMVRDPSNVMVQEYLDQAGSKGLRARVNKALGFASEREYRVHVENGQVVPGLVTPRYTDPLSKIFNRGEIKEVSHQAQNLVDSLPEKYRTGTFGMDWIPTRDGKFKMVESNPSGRSGMLGLIPSSGTLLQKHYTGQWGHHAAGAMAGAGAAGIGAATAGAVHLNNEYGGEDGALKDPKGFAGRLREDLPDMQIPGFIQRLRR